MPVPFQFQRQSGPGRPPARTRHRRLAAALLGGALIAAAALAPWLAPSSARAQTDEAQLRFNADELIQAEEGRVLIARGAVELAYGERILLADEVRYDRGSNIVSATGDIALLEPSGETLFADYAELTGDLRAGFIDGIGARLADDSVFAGAYGERYDGRITRVAKGVFSPCLACAKDGETPFWALKARRIIHDSEARDIIYHNAWMEIMGLPVAWTPYFSHPDPTVEQRSGLLMPRVGSTPALGAFARGYYYWGRAPHEDFTFETLAATDKEPLLAVEWRRHFGAGDIFVKGSGTHSEEERGPAGAGEAKDAEFRGHINARGDFDLSRHWRTRFQLRRTTDDPFLFVYDFPAEDILDSFLELEGFHGRNYSFIGGREFQDLRSGDRAEPPTIAPQLGWEGLGRPGGLLGGRWQAQLDSLALTRTDGPDLRKAVAELGWRRQDVLGPGLVTELGAQLAGDLYWLDDQPAALAGNDGEALEGRILPAASATFRLPLARRLGDMTHSVEPVLQLVAMPELDREDDIPNEDSQDLELDTTNLLAINRFPGSDRRESGLRASWALRSRLMRPGGGHVQAMVGQSLRLTGADDNVPAGSGLVDDVSDLVGGIQIAPVEAVDLVYRFRVDPGAWVDRRHEARGRFELGPAELDATYLFAESLTATGLREGQEQIRLDGEMALGKHWTVGAHHRRELGDGGGSLRTGASVKFENCCVEIGLVAERDFTERDGVDNGDSVLLRLAFKHLGEVETPELTPGGIATSDE